MLCGEYSMAHETPGEHTASLLECRSWTCEHCLPKRLRELKHLAAEGNAERFITLTSKLDHRLSPDEAAKQLRTAWRNIVQVWKRDNPGQKMEYLAVFEETKQGWPHLHILQRGPYMSQTKISRLMQKYTGSPICWIDSVANNNRAARYVSKYVSKGPGRFEGCKRYWRSQGWALNWRVKMDAPVHDAGAWVMVGLEIDEVATEYKEQGWRVTWPSASTIKAKAQPGCHPVIWPPPSIWSSYGRYT